VIHVVVIDFHCEQNVAPSIGNQDEILKPRAPGWFFWRGPGEPFPFARARGCWGADSLQARLPFLDNNPSRIAHAAKMALAPDEPMTHIDSMTAIAEIESAIERLSPAEVKELAAWLDEYQQIINASAEIFSMYDQEEKAGS